MHCEDSCAFNNVILVHNGLCEDGGQGSVQHVFGLPQACELGTDCSDCGPRFMLPPSPPPSPGRRCIWRNRARQYCGPCAVTPGACVGSSGDVLDGLCGAHRRGPYCEVCEAEFYKDDSGNCTKCTDAFAVFGGDSVRSWLPFVILLSIVSASFITYVFAKVWSLLKDKPLTPSAWERLDMKPTRVANEIFSRRLKEALQRRVTETVIHFRKDEWKRFKIRYELKAENFIKVRGKSTAVSIWRCAPSSRGIFRRTIIL